MPLRSEWLHLDLGSKAFLALFFVLLDCGPSLDGVIIPPKWANETINPCAGKSWQLLHWPEDNACYNIFTQGPCKETQEFFFDHSQGRASCRCSRGTSWHPATQRCHQAFSKGPCGHKEYFSDEGGADVATTLPQGTCKKYKDCPPGHLFWPSQAQCYPHLSRGPCVDGHLLYMHQETGSTTCGCHPKLMSTNFWRHERSCHELFTKGPCIDGHVFIYNLTKAETECVCGPHLLTNYHKPTGRCFQVDTVGPCRQGQIFTYDSRTNEAKCSCLKGYVEWLPTGTCYRAFTRGPCFSGEFLQPHEIKKGVGLCVKNTCSQGELLDPKSNKCYQVGRRGPCPRGKLWVFERATSVRGLCHCDPQLIGYWSSHGICYELGKRGPCPKRKVLSYDKKTGLPKCHCDRRHGFVPWANGRCIKAGVRRNQLVPVAGSLGPSLGSNTIQVERVHRGLTLPLQERLKSNVSSSVPQVLQEEILKDVLATILKNDTSSTDVIDSGGIPDLKPLQQPKLLQESQPEVITETHTERTVHSIAVSRSVTWKKPRWVASPQGERQHPNTEGDKRRLVKRRRRVRKGELSRLKGVPRKRVAGARQSRNWSRNNYYSFLQRSQRSE